MYIKIELYPLHVRFEFVWFQSVFLPLPPHEISHPGALFLTCIFIMHFFFQIYVFDRYKKYIYHFFLSFLNSSKCFVSFHCFTFSFRISSLNGDGSPIPSRPWFASPNTFIFLWRKKETDFHDPTQAVKRWKLNTLKIGFWVVFFKKTTTPGSSFSRGVDFCPYFCSALRGSLNVQNGTFYGGGYLPASPGLSHIMRL